MTDPNPHARVHKVAVVTGATTIIMHDLCRDMARLHCITGDTDMKGIAQACAIRIMHSDKCREIERIVDAVLEDSDGMPAITNQPLLANILACYSVAAQAERDGISSEYRKTMLVPAIVEEAMTSEPMSEDEQAQFVNSINQYADCWDTYLPSTPFQVIVCDAIKRINI